MATRDPRHRPPLGERRRRVLQAGRQGPGGRRVEADYQITDYEPNTRLAFKATAGPVRPTGEYLFEEVDGGTRLTFVLQAELSGIKKLLMSGAVQKTMDAEVGATERLKSLLESMPAASPRGMGARLRSSARTSRSASGQATSERRAPGRAAVEPDVATADGLREPEPSEEHAAEGPLVGGNDELDITARIVEAQLRFARRRAPASRSWSLGELEADRQGVRGSRSRRRTAWTVCMR